MRPQNSEVETQPITGLFPSSHDVQINNSQFNDFSQIVYNPKEGTCECVPFGFYDHRSNFEP